MAPDLEPIINSNPQLQAYYDSLESRIGYRLFLGDTRHFGFYSRDTYWPFPINRALRAMEDELAASLNLPPCSYVLDAGCGVGHVAIHLATNYGFKVRAIDIVQHHLDKARRNVAQSGLPKDQVEVQKMDYHHLESLLDKSFDGIYAMETIVHATEPEAVLASFYRILRPGGRLSIFAYDHDMLDNSPEACSMRMINDVAAMPTNTLSRPGMYQRMLEDIGFTNLAVRDYSRNIRPMTRLFYVVAYIPYLIITLLGLERYFINTVAGVQTYRGYGHWRYINIIATKPGGPIEAPEAR